MCIILTKKQPLKFPKKLASNKMRPRQRSSNLGLLLLGYQLMQMGLDNIPPVTLAVLGLNVYLFIFPVAPLMKACVSVDQAYWLKDWRRLLLSPFHHADDMHLYFNMASLLWKGVRLERRLGGPYFLYILSVFSVATGLVYLLLEAALTELTQDYSFSMQCAVGFSGVLFGLKVLVNHYFPGGMSYVMGIPVSNRYASWAELVLIHITSPGTSFIGHLSGILVGLLYASGPLKIIMQKCADIVTFNGADYRPRTHYRSSGKYFCCLYLRFKFNFIYKNSNYFYFTGYSGFGDNTPHYTGGLTEEEQLETAIRNSLNEREQAQRPTPPPYGFPLSEEEMRQRRLRRFEH
ncbi:hypothetical protein WMY93_029244 [Mugilogobius chulae]|uniref:Peptidase S54 rhomboid domain-containing protein n=1 Tax=Mugilogobius chulae TaxID=88201 RepID=A0AAW0MRP3_9GOBI